MKYEIKEILDDLLFTTLPNVSVKLSKEKLNQLKDYITNLQEENKRLEHDYKIALKLISRYEKRIDKANEIIDEVLFVGVKNYRSQLEIVQKVIKGDDNE